MTEGNAMAEPEKVVPRPKGASLWWYTPIVVIILAGYVAGGAFSFGTAFLGWFSAVRHPAGRLCLQLFGMGLLGASLYCSTWWALDHEDALLNERARPTCLDWFGYATLIVGGGITGVLLYLLVRYGVSLVAAPPETPVRPSAALVIALTGGLFHFKVRAMLGRLFRSLESQPPSAPAPSDK